MITIKPNASKALIPIFRCEKLNGLECHDEADHCHAREDDRPSSRPLRYDTAASPAPATRRMAPTHFQVRARTRLAANDQSAVWTFPHFGRP